MWWLWATVHSHKFFVMIATAKRTNAYIDGFNLYHAIDEVARRDPQKRKLKWLDLRALCEVFSPIPQYDLREVAYFSAYATWLTGPYRRHQIYTDALTAIGVNCIMGEFKEKRRKCKRCGSTWVGHEEKESDVALGVRLVMDAFLDRYDRALVITADADIVPAVKTVRSQFSTKHIQILTPPGLVRCNQLIGAAGGRNNCKPIKWVNIERSLLPDKVYDSKGNLAASRPAEYGP